MKKNLLFVLVFLLIVQFVSATDIEISKSDKNTILISEFGGSASYELTIHNPGPSQKAELYSFVGVTFEPKEKFDVQSGDTIIEIKAYPPQSYLDAGGTYNFEYVLIPEDFEAVKDTVLMKIVKLKDIIEVKSDDIMMGDNSVKVSITNLEKVKIEDLKVKLSSLFFDYETSVSLEPEESKEILIPLKWSELEELLNGGYEFNFEMETPKGNIPLKGTFSYLPKEDSVLIRDAKGFIIRKVSYTRTNIGNTPIVGKIEFDKDVFSRLFSINSAEPTLAQRKALFATYYYEKTLQPGESFSVETTTNYTLPFVLILLVIIVALLVKLYSRTNVVLDKRVHFVKTRGGEFALKVSLHVKAKKFVENVQVIDRLPGMTQLYEKFGIKPDKIDTATRRLFWNIERLNAGEERIYSYIIFSKVSVVGRFELPSASAMFQRDGKSEQVFSNRTFFVAEQTRSA